MPSKPLDYFVEREVNKYINIGGQPTLTKVSALCYGDLAIVGDPGRYTVHTIPGRIALFDVPLPTKEMTADIIMFLQSRMNTWRAEVDELTKNEELANKWIELIYEALAIYYPDYNIIDTEVRSETKQIPDYQPEPLDDF